MILKKILKEIFLLLKFRKVPLTDLSVFHFHLDPQINASLTAITFNMIKYGQINQRNIMESVWSKY